MELQTQNVTNLTVAVLYTIQIQKQLPIVSNIILI